MPPTHVLRSSLESDIDKTACLAGGLGLGIEQGEGEGLIAAVRVR